MEADDVLEDHESDCPLLRKLPLKLRNGLLPFQREGVRYAVDKNGRCLLADEMGLGKTIQAIAVAYFYRDEWPMLIIVPSSLKFCWIEELEKWLPDILPSQINLVQCGSDASGVATSLITIITYGLLRLPSSKVIREAVSARKFKVIICDESHYLKNSKTLSSKTVIPLLKAANHRILLSGTPALAKPVELYTQIDAICPGKFGTFWQFTDRYCDARTVYYGKFRKRVVDGASNLEELQQRLKSMLMIRREKSAVLTELPPKQRQRVLFELKESVVKKEILDRFAELKQRIHKRGQKVMQVLQHERSSSYEGGATGSPVLEVGGMAQSEGSDVSVHSQISKLYKLSGEAKIGPVKDYIEMLCDNEQLKFLVFAYHHDMMDGIQQTLWERKVKFVRIDGNTTGLDRQAFVTQFQSDPETRVAILSILAAGVGLTFTAAKLVVFAELYWTPGVMLQCEDRAHRIGQTSSLPVHYLVARGTMDEWVWSAVCKKTIVTSTALTGKKKVLDHDEGDQYQIDLLSNADMWNPDEGTDNISVADLVQSQRPHDQSCIMDFFTSQNDPEISSERKKKLCSKSADSLKCSADAPPASVITISDEENDDEEWKELKLHKLDKQSRGKIMSNVNRRKFLDMGNVDGDEDEFKPSSKMRKVQRKARGTGEGKTKDKNSSTTLTTTSSASHIVKSSNHGDENGCLEAFGTEHGNREGNEGSEKKHVEPKSSDDDSLPDITVEESTHKNMTQGHLSSGNCPHNTCINGDSHSSLVLEHSIESSYQQQDSSEPAVACNIDTCGEKRTSLSAKYINSTSCDNSSENETSSNTQKDKLFDNNSSVRYDPLPVEMETSLPITENPNDLQNSEFFCACYSSSDVKSHSELHSPKNKDQEKHSAVDKHDDQDVPMAETVKTPKPAEKLAKKYQECCVGTDNIRQGVAPEVESWSCGLCTFQNHPLLPQCEMCDTPKRKRLLKQQQRDSFTSLKSFSDCLQTKETPTSSTVCRICGTEKQNLQGTESGSIVKNKNDDNSDLTFTKGVKSPNSNKSMTISSSAGSNNGNRNVHKLTGLSSPSLKDDDVVAKTCDDAVREMGALLSSHKRGSEHKTSTLQTLVSIERMNSGCESPDLFEENEMADSQDSFFDKDCDNKLLNCVREFPVIENCGSVKSDIQDLASYISDDSDLEDSALFAGDGSKVENLPPVSSRCSLPQSHNVSPSIITAQPHGCGCNTLTNSAAAPRFVPSLTSSLPVSESVISQPTDSLRVSMAAPSAAVASPSYSTLSNTLSASQSLPAGQGLAYHKVLKFTCSLHTGRIYVYDEHEQSLQANFHPIDIEVGNTSDLAEILQLPCHQRLLRKFVREWSSLTDTKKRLIAKRGLIFTSPLAAYDEVKSIQGSKQRHRNKQDSITAAMRNAKDVHGSVRMITKHCNVPTDLAVESLEKERTSVKGVAQTVTEAGVPLCLQCHQPYSNPLLSSKTISKPENAWQLRLCSFACMDKYWILTKASYCRDQIYDVERGVCRLCQYDAHALFKQIKITKDAKTRAELINKSPFSSLASKQRQRMVEQPQAGQFWHVDHITPVWQGGGMCDLDNLRTLCTPCHLKVTRRQAGQRAAMKKLSGAATQGDITAFFQRS